MSTNLSDRKAHTVYLPRELDLKQLAHDNGYRFPARFMADAIYAALGKPELQTGPDLPEEQPALLAS